jgi:hypothetical protein
MVGEQPGPPASADALALLPARNGPWHGGEVGEIAPLGP